MIGVKIWDDDSHKPIGSLASIHSDLVSNFVTPVSMYIAPSKGQLSPLYTIEAILQTGVSLLFVRFRYGL